MTVNILLHICPGEENYLGVVKAIPGVSSAKVFLSNVVPKTVMEIVMAAKAKDCKFIATTNETLLKLFLSAERKPSLDAFSGSIFKRYDCEIMILPPLEQLMTVPYTKHLYARYLKKFFDPSSWLQIPVFRWSLFEPKDAGSLRNLFESATFIACDIETGSEDDRVITCISFTAVFFNYNSKSFTTKTIVVPFTDLFNVLFARSILGTSSPKVFQNGKYDNAYLLRYNCPTFNWAFDTINMFHAWYSELPKDLGFLTAYLLRDWEYWKDEGKTAPDLHTYYTYNAKDSFTTAMDLLALLREMPDWAIFNFRLEFPVIFPCLLAEMVGIKADKSAMGNMREQMAGTIASNLASVQRMVGCSFYNPNSPQQTLRLFESWGCKDITDTKPPSRDKVAQRHPIYRRVLDKVESIRKDRKLNSNYLVEEKLWNGRVFYSINPHATDTGRLNSTESPYWCGLQMQNIPSRRTDIKIKSMFIADRGFYLGEADGEQAEARDTAYLSGDLRLIETVEGDKDYHGVNASRFFGVPYEKIIGPGGKKLDKVLRDDIGKRINHGANYNMGAGVLIDTMGIANVLKAKEYLKLPRHWTLKQVATHLLDLYDKAYPVVRDAKNGWYAKCIRDVTSTHFLIGPAGWHRYCFADPTKNKHWLNSYVAHPPQNNSAMRLNKLYVRVMNEVWLPNQRDFKLHMQIHDSIVFQYRIGRIDLAYKVKHCMEDFSMQVKDSFGIERTLRVPVAVKGEHERWSELKDLPKLAA